MISALQIKYCGLIVNYCEFQKKIYEICSAEST